MDLTGDLSTNQFGFRVERSTDDAITKVLDTAKWTETGNPQYKVLCVMVALDITNVFNATTWGHIDAVLLTIDTLSYPIKILRYYVSHRTLEIRPAAGPVEVRPVTGGAPLYF